MKRKLLNLIMLFLLSCFLMVGCGNTANKNDDNQTIEDQDEDDEDTKDDDKDTNESDDVEDTEEDSSDVQQESYPREVELSTGEVDGILDLVEILAWMGEYDFPNDAQDTMEFCKNFPMMSMLGYEKVYQKIISNYPDAYIEEYYLHMPEATLQQYLMDSIGYNDLSALKATAQSYDVYDYVGYNGSEFRFIAPDAGEMTVDNCTIDKIVALSEDEIHVTASANYNALDSATTYFLEIRLKRNLNSIWGGYTLMEISRCDKYILPTSDSEYLTEQDLKGYDSYYLRLARNEIYARHGYIFKDQILQHYFGTCSWYNPTVTNVLESELNEFEKANLALIKKMESQVEY